ncbi:hypothetical protein [Actinopolyspora erythraea]|uniref:hypothetical protein n=1 Tax=Actinopolyspora erythraea TaxID=414996 RepID=UPI000693E6EB|nr:hypothetical protein [Actinopolyspora erythraea]
MTARVVDRENQAWLRVSGQDGGSYMAETSRELGTLSEFALEEARGPLRPVVPVPEGDVERLWDVFDRAGVKSVATLASALETVFQQHRDHKGGMSNPSESFEYAQRSMIAGRPGSWESEVLLRVILFGNGLNLAKPSSELPERDVEARRRAGPRARVHRAGQQDLVTLVRRWTSNPGQYVEVAETVATVVATYADRRYGADGWRQIADQWLRPGALAREDFQNCYRLFYGSSRFFDPSLV